MTRLGLLVLPALLSSGCFIYSGDDDCDYGGGATEGRAADFLAASLRNPFSGQCEDGGGGGGGGGGCYQDEAPTAPEDWAICYGGCEGLDEAGCLATYACRAAYVSSCADWQGCSEQSYTFFECWGTAPSGVIQGGSCEGLDAYQCSRHDDCVAQHYASSSCGGGTPAEGADCAPQVDPSLVGVFQACAPEPTQETGCYEDFECASGTTCNSEDVCLPGPYACGASPEADALIPCDNRCYGYCVPIGDPDPGNCYEPAFCDSLPPSCPDGTIAGVRNGCWSGYCIPVAECPDDPPACETLGESDCLANGQCTPHYQGTNCSMIDGVWTCQSYEFTYCGDAIDSP